MEMLDFKRAQQKLLSGGQKSEELLAELFKSFLNFVEQITSSTAFAATYRKKSGSFDKFLRPVLMYPGELGKKYEENPEDWRATRFEISHLNSPEKREHAARDCYLQDSSFSQLLDNKHEENSLRSRAKLNISGWRDDKFVLSSNDSTKSQSFREAASNPHGRCIIFAITQPNQDEIEDLLAVYLTSKNCSTELETKQITDLAEAAEFTINMIDQLSLKSRYVLLSGLHALNLSLEKELKSSVAVTPAHIVSKFRDETLRLLKSDCFFGSNFVKLDLNAKQSCEGVSSVLSVWFVNIAFTEKSKSSGLLPSFKLYPRQVAMYHKKAAYRINSDAEATLVELLADDWIADRIKKYKSFAREPSIEGLRSDKKFKAALKKLQAVKADGDTTGDPEFGILRKVFRAKNKWSHLCTKTKTGHGKCDLWDALNCDVDDGKQTQTVASFLLFPIEMDDINEPPVPQAAIVFESRLPDALSNIDYEILSEFAAVLESILRGLQLSKLKSSFVEKARIASANHDHKEIFDMVTFGQIEFELLRLDMQWVSDFEPEKFIQDDQRRNASNLVRNFLLENLITPEAVSDESGPISDKRKVAASERLKWIRGNRNKIIKFFEELADQEMKNSAYTFLRACPSNVLWHCYASAAQRALASRNLNADFTLSSLQPGMSAANMFVLSNGAEIRQVIKFGSKEAIQREQTRYKDYVRYRVLNAARIPLEAVAYESVGVTGLAGSETYGVIVSDLIGGKSGTDNDHTFTLLDVILHQNTSSAHEPTTSEVQKTLDDLLNLKLGLWSQLGNLTDQIRSVENDGIKFIKRLVRIKSSEQIKAITPAHLAAWFEASQSSKSKLSYNEFMGLVDSATCTRDGNRENFSVPRAISNHAPNLFIKDSDFFKICHGDLNARNISWSALHNQFFLLDFEHTDKGFKGQDETKLIVSLLTDIIGQKASDERNTSPPEKWKMNFSEVCQHCGAAIDVLVEWLNAALQAPHQNGTIFWQTAATVTLLSVSPTSPLSSAIIAVLEKLDLSISTNKCPAAVIAYAFTCVAFKHLEYACRNLIANDDLPILQKLDWTNRSNALDEAVRSTLSPIQCGRVASFVIATMLCAKIAEVINHAPH